MGIWDRFDDIANTEEVKEAQSKYAPVEAGEYDCVLEELVPSESKNGLPMLKGKFKRVDGGSYIFYNQMLQNLNNPEMTAVNIAEAVSFVSKLAGETIEFKGLADFARRIEELPTGDTYRIKVSYSDKDVEHKFARLKCIGLSEPAPFDM